MAAIDFDDLVSSLNGSCIGQEAMDLRALHVRPLPISLAEKRREESETVRPVKVQAEHPGRYPSREPAAHRRDDAACMSSARSCLLASDLSSERAELSRAARRPRDEACSGPGVVGRREVRSGYRCNGRSVSTVSLYRLTYRPLGPLTRAWACSSTHPRCLLAACFRVQVQTLLGLTTPSCSPYNASPALLPSPFFSLSQAHLSQTLFLPSQSAQAGQPTPANSFHCSNGPPPPPPSSFQSAANGGQQNSFSSHMSAQRPPALSHQSSYNKGSSFIEGSASGSSGGGYGGYAPSPHHPPTRLPFTPVSGNSMPGSPASYSAFHSQVASPQEPAHHQNPFGFAGPPPGGGFAPAQARQTRSQTKALRDQQQTGGGELGLSGFYPTAAAGNGAGGGFGASNVPPLSGGSASWARRASSNSRRSLNSAHVAEDVEM